MDDKVVLTRGTEEFLMRLPLMKLWTKEKEEEEEEKMIPVIEGYRINPGCSSWYSWRCKRCRPKGGWQI